MNNELKELIQDIVGKTGGTYILNEKQVSKLINKSTSTLGRWRKNKIGIEYRRRGEARNAAIEYTVQNVAKYILSNSIKVN